MPTDDSRRAPDPSAFPVVGGFVVDEAFSAGPRAVRVGCPQAMPTYRSIEFGDDGPEIDAPSPFDDDAGVVPSRRAPPAYGDGVMLSIAAVDGGVRLFHRGLMAPWRATRLEVFLRPRAAAWDRLDVFLVDAVPGRVELLVRCDVVVAGAVGPRIVSLLGGPRPLSASRWWPRFLRSPRVRADSRSTG